MRSKAMLMAIGGSLLLALAVGCNREQAKQKQAPPQAAAAVLQKTAPSRAETAGPLFPLTGTVAETFNSGGYTYLRVKAADREYWVATGQAAFQKGQKVTMANGQVMRNFHSPTLNRTFPEIIFTAGLGGDKGQKTVSLKDADGSTSFTKALQKEQGQQPPAGMADTAAMMGSTKAIVPAADIHVAKATGKNAYQIGEIFEKAAQLDGKQVRVRGKVTKVSPNIMGRNWIHLQDGTGNAMRNTHELVVTSTSAQPKIGQVVTMQGVLHANKDFGAGYRYAAIVEDAKIVK